MLLVYFLKNIITFAGFFTIINYQLSVNI